MSSRPKKSTPWLDSLALWAARGRDRSRPAPVAELEVSAAAGTTRRAALRVAAGVAGTGALLGPMRLLEPEAIAGAATTESAQEECLKYKDKTAAEDFQACVKKPMEELGELEEEIATQRVYIRKQKNPVLRKKLVRVLDQYLRERAREQKKVEFCNAALISDRAEGAKECYAKFPELPEAEGGPACGSSLLLCGPGGSGCEDGFLLCGEECCEVRFAFCQGCGGSPTCCRNEGNCCPRVE